MSDASADTVLDRDWSKDFGIVPKASRISHSEARKVLESIWSSATGGKTPNRAQLQYIQGIGVIESGYGSGKAAYNWGSLQCNHGPPSRQGECVILTDHKADGTAFQYPYRIYKNHAEGAAGMLSLIAKKWPSTLDYASKGLTHKASESLYGYYTGIGTREKCVLSHAKGVYNAAKEIARAIGEPLELIEPGVDANATVDDPSLLNAIGGVFLMGVGILAPVLLLKGRK